MTYSKMTFGMIALVLTQLVGIASAGTSTAANPPQTFTNTDFMVGFTEVDGVNNESSSALVIYGKISALWVAGVVHVPASNVMVRLRLESAVLNSAQTCQAVALKQKLGQDIVKSLNPSYVASPFYTFAIKGKSSSGKVHIYNAGTTWDIFVTSSTPALNCFSLGL